MEGIAPLVFATVPLLRLAGVLKPEAATMATFPGVLINAGVGTLRQFALRAEAD